MLKVCPRCRDFTQQRFLEGDAAAASAGMIARYQAMSSQQIYEPVLDLLPTSPCRVLDIGAGTGRDAAWLTAQGHTVLAVEPAAGWHGPLGFGNRMAGRSAPQLEGVKRLVDRVILCGVWQHLEEHQRPPAIASLRRLTAVGGRVMLYLRHGPGAPHRPVWPTIVPQQSTKYLLYGGFRVARQRRGDQTHEGRVDCCR